MYNHFKVGMWVKDMDRERIAQITDIRKETVTLAVKRPFPHYDYPGGIGITINCDQRTVIESWNVFVWNIEQLTEQERLELMVEKL